MVAGARPGAALPSLSSRLKSMNFMRRREERVVRAGLAAAADADAVAVAEEKVEAPLGVADDEKWTVEGADVPAPAQGRSVVVEGGCGEVGGRRGRRSFGMFNGAVERRDVVGEAVVGEKSGWGGGRGGGVGIVGGGVAALRGGIEKKRKKVKKVARAKKERERERERSARNLEKEEGGVIDLETDGGEEGEVVEVGVEESHSVATAVPVNSRGDAENASKRRKRSKGKFKKPKL